MNLKNRNYYDWMVLALLVVNFFFGDLIKGSQESRYILIVLIAVFSVQYQIRELKKELIPAKV